MHQTPSSAGYKGFQAGGWVGRAFMAQSGMVDIYISLFKIIHLK